MHGVAKSTLGANRTGDNRTGIDTDTNSQGLTGEILFRDPRQHFLTSQDSIGGVIRIDDGYIKRGHNRISLKLCDYTIVFFEYHHHRRKKGIQYIDYFNRAERFGHLSKRLDIAEQDGCDHLLRFDLAASGE
ncbi:hypothetical protein MnTg03_00807 [bacterium MnTg03]|nr:hypothetical protein MnTg03_00807 [bacterium MnTg03]